MTDLSLGTITNTDIQTNDLVNLLSENTFIGVDFGTSTSVVSIISINDRGVFAQPIKISQKNKFGGEYMEERVPTVISIFNNQVLVGKGAGELKFDLQKDVSVFHSFKMDLGEQVYYPRSKFKRIRCPKDATKVFIQFIKNRIERYCSENLLAENYFYSFSIPASFEANQRSEFLTALKDNGISIDGSVLIDEPNAAFVSYLRNRFVSGNPLVLPSNSNLNYLVFDFGAGTCDVSILEMGSRHDGIFTKNLAISNFEKIGGRDIDRLIVEKALLDQFFELNSLEREDFSEVEINQIIIPNLLKAAEQLKIAICENVNIQFDFKNYKLPDLAFSDDLFKLNVNQEIDTTKGLYNLPHVSISYRTFYHIIKDLLKVSSEGISIFNPIVDVLSKAKLDKTNIFAVLFIGGSCKNPYVINAISRYFSGSEKLIPLDLQTHVSEGTAINSMFYHGLNRTILKQITSNAILLETRDGLVNLINPGVEIPSEERHINYELVTWREGQDIRLPFFTSAKKHLYDIYLKDSSGNGFSENTKVEISYRVDINKNFEIVAKANGISVDVKLENPFMSGSNMSYTERNIIKAERAYQHEKNMNAFISVKTYKQLIEAYLANGDYLLAANIMEECNEVHNGIYSLNEIGLKYSSAGSSDDAIRCYEEALKNYPNNATIMFNLSYQLDSRNPEKENLLSKAISSDPNNEPALIELAKIEKAKGNVEKSKEYNQRAFNLLNEKYENGTLEEWRYSWFSSLSDSLGKSDLAKEIRKKDKKYNDLLDDRVIVKNDIVNYFTK